MQDKDMPNYPALGIIPVGLGNDTAFKKPELLDDILQETSVQPNGHCPLF